MIIITVNYCLTLVGMNFIMGQSVGKVAGLCDESVPMDVSKDTQSFPSGGV